MNIHHIAANSYDYGQLSTRESSSSANRLTMRSHNF